MKERPILFSGPMVRAILAGTKTITRRVVKPQPERDPKWVGGYRWSRRPVTLTRPVPEIFCLPDMPQANPYGQPGDRLYVKEQHEFLFRHGDVWCLYKADMAERRVVAPYVPAINRGRPSIHMPRWASRITLEITEVRVERLQDISEADAIAEGCEAAPFPGPWWQGYRDLGDGKLIHQQHVGSAPPAWMIEPKRMPDTAHLDRTARDAYRALWEQINGAGSWDANPWVWVIGIRRTQ